MGKKFGTKTNCEEAVSFFLAIFAIIGGAAFFISGFRFVNVLDTIIRWVTGAGLIAFAVGYIMHLRKQGKL